MNYKFQTLFIFPMQILFDLIHTIKIILYLLPPRNLKFITPLLLCEIRAMGKFE